MLTRRLAVPALALALALTACGGGDGGGDAGGDAAPSPSSSAGPDAAALVRTAAMQTAKAGPSKFMLTSTTVIGSQDVTFSGEGAFDPVARTGQLSFDVPGADGSPSGGGRIEQRIIGPDLYLTLPQTPGTFYRLKVADVAGTSLGGSTDPTASLQALTELADVQEVGTEQVRGAETTHYEGTYDVEAAIAGAQGPAKAVLQATLGALELDAVPFDAYVDADGRLVRFEQELELPATPQTAGQPLRSRTVLELFDFGTAVVVTPPPAATVKDGAPLLAALKAAVPQPSTKVASPPPPAPGPASSAPASPAPVSPAPVSPGAPVDGSPAAP